MSDRRVLTQLSDARRPAVADCVGGSGPTSQGAAGVPTWGRIHVQLARGALDNDARAAVTGDLWLMWRPGGGVDRHHGLAHEGLGRAARCTRWLGMYFPGLSFRVLLKISRH